MESAITVKGQATIPKAIREHLRSPAAGLDYAPQRRGRQLCSFGKSTTLPSGCTKNLTRSPGFNRR
jgi:hypothetical protein